MRASELLQWVSCFLFVPNSNLEIPILTCGYVNHHYLIFKPITSKVAFFFQVLRLTVIERCRSWLRESLPIFLSGFSSFTVLTSVNAWCPGLACQEYLLYMEYISIKSYSDESQYWNTCISCDPKSLFYHFWLPLFWVELVGVSLQLILSLLKASVSDCEEPAVEDTWMQANLYHTSMLKQ